MSVVVLGSLNMDLTTYVPRLPRPGETLLGRSFKVVPGGKGANQAVAAARLGSQVRLFGRLGRDDFGDQHLSAMRLEGVDTTGVKRDEQHPTGLAVISVEDSGENWITVISGANMAVDEEDVARCAQAMSDAKVLLLQLEIPLGANIAAADEARRRGLTVILDPAPAGILPDTLFPMIDVITPNEVEAAALVGHPVVSEKDAFAASAILRQKGVPTAIIKMGERGAVYETATDRGRVAAFQVNAVDSVAAGDAFNGALATALAEGQEIRQAVRWGAAAGALAVTRSGALPSLPHRDEMIELLQSDRPSEASADG
jgi:ribokinase